MIVWPRIDLLLARLVWHLGTSRKDRADRVQFRAPGATRSLRPEGSRTVGLAMVSPDMVAEAALAAGWPPVMTLEEAAEAMRISPQTLRRYVSEGKFKKSVKRGWPTLFWRDSLISEFMKGPRR